MTAVLLPISGALKPKMTPFFIINAKGRKHAVSIEDARKWWQDVPEARGKIKYTDEAGEHFWDGGLVP